MPDIDSYEFNEYRQNRGYYGWISKKDYLSLLNQYKKEKNKDFYERSMRYRLQYPSSLEQKIIEFLDLNHIHFSREYEIEDDLGNIKYYDFLLLDLHILIEADSLKYHSSQDQINNDEEKSILAKIKGFFLLRVHWNDYFKILTFLVQKLKQKKLI